jgi:4-amino-4-deoxy-L-arabinose transferase-like glycosyltransferase
MADQRHSVPGDATPLPAVMPNGLGVGLVTECVLLVLLAAALRLPWLGRESLWIDELFSVEWSQMDLRFLLGDGARIETNPPAYYVFLHAWMALFGAGEATVRLPSVLASLATVPVVQAIGGAVASRGAGRLAALLFALDPLSVAYAQEARGYSLSVLLAALALLSLAAYLRKLDDDALQRSWGWLAGFVAAAAATAFLHYTALLFVAACFGATGVLLILRRPFPRREAAVWIVLAIGTAAVLARPALQAAALSGSNNLVWIEPLSLQGVLDFLFDLIVPLPRMDGWLAASWIVLAWMALTVGLALPVLWRLGARFQVLVLSPILYCGLLIGVSWIRPMLLVRVAIWLIVPLCVLLALAALAQARRILRVAACLVPVTAFAAGSAAHIQFDRKEDWRAVAQLVLTRPECTGPVLVGEFNALGVLYYGLYGRRPISVFLPDPRRRNSVEFALSQRLMHLPEIDPAAVVASIRQHPGTAVILHGDSRERMPEDFRSMVAQASFSATLAGLTVACF